MKFLIIFGLSLIAVSASAQSAAQMPPMGSDAQGLSPFEPHEVVSYAPKEMIRKFGTTGRVFDYRELTALPVRSIDKIAGLTLGVDAHFKGGLIIRGAKDGTAYFVDGVRVRSGEAGLPGAF
ncbi:MAG: hypothetical protein LCH37_14965 [Bacteroidetes bacterium]|nr:hypothetical protein [Bacteroidota bacterium]